MAKTLTLAATLAFVLSGFSAPVQAQGEAAPATAPTAEAYRQQVRDYEALLARYGQGIQTWNQLVSAAPRGYRVDYIGPYW